MSIPYYPCFQPGEGPPIYVPVEAVLDKGSGVVHTPEHGEVGVVVFERVKVDGVGIQVSQDPALLLCHKTWFIHSSVKLKVEAVLAVQPICCAWLSTSQRMLVLQARTMCLPPMFDICMDTRMSHRTKTKAKMNKAKLTLTTYMCSEVTNLIRDS